MQRRIYELKDAISTKVNIGGYNYYIKTSRNNEGEYGIEPILEVIVNRLTEILKIPSARYEFCLAKVTANGKESIQLATVCNDVRNNESTELLNVDDLYNSGLINSIDYNAIQSVITNKEQLDKMLLLDFVVCNEDRNNKNIAFVNDNGIKLLPVFNNGHSLLYNNIRGMRGDFRKAITKCNCNAFYENFNNAIKHIVLSNDYDIKKLDININFRAATLESKLREVYKECYDIKREYPNINLPDSEWFQGVFEFINWRVYRVQSMFRV